MTVGMGDQAVSAFLKASLVREAIDACVELNQVLLSQTVSCDDLMTIT